MHMLVTYIYIMYKAYVSPGAFLSSLDCSVSCFVTRTRQRTLEDITKLIEYPYQYVRYPRLLKRGASVAVDVSGAIPTHSQSLV
jgi:hypothetical protein